MRLCHVAISLTVLFGLCARYCGAQDPDRGLRDAQARLRAGELAKSKTALDYLIQKARWTRSGSHISGLYGLKFDDSLVAPLLDAAKGRGVTPDVRMIWHAIAYTQTDAGDRFLSERRKNGTVEERALAKACFAARTLRGLGVQCDLHGDGSIQQIFTGSVRKPLSRDNVRIIAELPNVRSLSLDSFADGALEPLRSMQLLEYVHLRCRTPYVDEAIQCLGASKKLKVLNVYGLATDKAMLAIGRLESLTCLRLNDSRITDQGLSHLRKLSRLSMLELNGTQLTDAGLKHLSGLVELQDLKVANTQIVGKGFVELRDMKKLRRLDLSGTKVADHALSNLSEFATLQDIEFLHLANTRVTDAGLVHLAELPNLKGIVLDGNPQITSAGLLTLAPLTDLMWVNSKGGRISEQAALRFAAGRRRSFYLTYTTAPDQPRRQVQGHPGAEVGKPKPGQFEQLRYRDDRLTKAGIAEVAAKGPRIVKPLLAALRKESLFSVEHVLQQLGPGIIDELRDELRREPQYKVFRAVSRTMRMHGMPVFPKLREWLRDDNKEVRYTASEAMNDILKQSKAPEGFERDLLRAMEDSHPQVRRNAVEMAIRMPELFETFEPRLTQIAVSDSYFNARASALNGIGDAAARLPVESELFSKAIRTVCDRVDDKNFLIRKLAIHHLDGLAEKDKRVLTALVRATADDRTENRAKAKAILKRLGHPADKD